MLKLRKANIKDLTILKAWDTEEHIQENIPDEYWNWEYELAREPEWREYLIAEVDGRPIGFIQIIDPKEEETHYWGEIEGNKRAIDIWIGEKNYLNKGYGTQMMQQALDRCFLNPDVTEVLIDPLESNQKGIRFYQRMGFRFLETRLFGKDICEVYGLRREHWNNS
jgi:aminoglycoside 6'-N-acetyltransferase